MSLKNIWGNIVDWFSGVANYEVGDLDPITGLAYPPMGTLKSPRNETLDIIKIIALGYFAVYAYSELKSPTRKTRKTVKSNRAFSYQGPKRGYTFG